MIQLVIGLLTVHIFATCVPHTSGYALSEENAVTNERQLVTDLMEGYENSIRPARNQSDTVDVEIDLFLSFLEDLDEVNQALLALGWMRMKWNDFQLIWDPGAYNGINMTRLERYRIWIPDLIIANSFEAYSRVPGYGQPALVYSTGDVLWYPTVRTRTFCPLDLTYFPFDEHSCHIMIMSWVYDELEMNITMFKAFYPKVVQSAEWELTMTKYERTSTRYPCCPNPFVDVKFIVTLKRRPTFASHLFVAPSVTLCLITPTIFILPPTAFEKLTLGTGLLIGHVLLLGELIKFVPSAHPTVPLMGKFFLANIVLVSLALAVSVIVVNCWNCAKTRRVGPPTIFQKLLLNWIVLKVLLVDFDEHDEERCVQSGNLAPTAGTEQAGRLEVMTDIAVTDSGMATTDDRVRIIDQQLAAARTVVKLDWLRLAVVVDRLCFVLFAIILIATCLSFTRYL